jgi:hypothetical protein
MRKLLIAALLSAALISFAPAKTEHSDINNIVRTPANVEQARKPATQEVAPLQEKTPEPETNLSEPVAINTNLHESVNLVSSPQPTNEVPAKVFCGSPAQRNTKNIVVSNALIGKQMAERYGWTGNEWNALLELWSCESSWTHTAINPESGAGGIPQSWPASKMASVGADYLSNPATQIEWGLRYIQSRYTTPSAALAYHYAKNFY